MPLSSAIIYYGQSQSCEITADCITTVGPDEAKFSPISDPASAVREAIAHPLEFPPLASATVPGDRVAIVIDPATPTASSAALGAVAAMRDAGVDPQRVTVVSVYPLVDECLHRALEEMNLAATNFVVHDPTDDESCALVAVTSAGQQLRLNRIIADADIVIPVTTASPGADESSVTSPFSGIFPAFADLSAQRQWHKSVSRDRRGAVDEKLAAASDEAGRLLGVYFAVLLVPASRGGAAGVYAGDPRAAAKSAARRKAEIWSRPTPEASELVIATVRGGRQEQTWRNLARAIELAGALASPDGAIAACCELSDAPNGLLRRLAASQASPTEEENAPGGANDDALVASALSRALQRGPIYLRSLLSDDVVEQLGMTPVADDGELARLASRRRRCVVIEDAHRVELQPQHSTV